VGSDLLQPLYVSYAATPAQRAHEDVRFPVHNADGLSHRGHSRDAHHPVHNACRRTNTFQRTDLDLDTTPRGIPTMANDAAVKDHRCQRPGYTHRGPRARAGTQNSSLWCITPKAEANADTTEEARFPVHIHPFTGGTQGCRRKTAHTRDGCSTHRSSWPAAHVSASPAAEAKILVEIGNVIRERTPLP